MNIDRIKENKKFLAATAIIAIVLITGGIWWWFKFAGAVSTDDARVKGTIVSVSSRVSARVEELHVREGDQVQAGQVIAKLESKELEVQVAQAKANLAAAQAKLAGVKAGNRPQQVVQAAASADSAAANLENAHKVYERTEALYTQGAVSAQQLDAAQSALAVAQAQYTAASQSASLVAEGSRPEDIQAAEAQVAQAAALLKNAQLQLDNATIISPISGTVALRSVNVGESVTMGQTIFNVVDSSDVWVAANIDETYIGKVHVGQSVEFTIDAFPNKKLKGEVREVGAATGSQFSLLPTENTSGNYTKVTQKLPVKITVSETGDTELKPGMSAVININVRS
ncbi:HlyD family secretion protein [Dendrosporobacter sp. 1207_IL3150]|uniref:HlyD family secretion protein n=1 Tax=Dendrosporobacter sp. 1207_IL3150 TaxID=3084054 RepID=UPI002FDB071A